MLESFTCSGYLYDTRISIFVDIYKKEARRHITYKNLLANIQDIEYTYVSTPKSADHYISENIEGVRMTLQIAEKEGRTFEWRGKLDNEEKLASVPL